MMVMIMMIIWRMNLGGKRERDEGMKNYLL